MNYYNEIEPYAAQWLRNLMVKGLIPNGEVDTRSIVDVSPDDLRSFTQCHFFAGIGGWSRALRLAGWPDDRPVWTGSCPCQPFSVAGKGLGTDDPRHLWPHFFRLIRSARPPVVMGEQVAGAAGYSWFDGVAADLEAEGYACRAVDVPACAVDAPHIRSRLYWVASSVDDALRGRHVDPHEAIRARRHCVVDADCGDMADADHGRCTSGVIAGSGDAADGGREADGQPGGGGDDMADADANGRGGIAQARLHERRKGASSYEYPPRRTDRSQRDHADGRGGFINGTFWSDAIWLTGADEKARRAQPGLPLLAHGIPARVGRLRAYGNAIVPQLAAEVIGAFMES